MSSRQARSHARSLPRARRTCGAGRARGEHEESDGENHQECMMGGGANAHGENIKGIGGAPLTVFNGAKFMQGILTTIEQVVRNTVQAMQEPFRAADTRATMAMKTFLQLRLLTFQGKPDPLVAKNWLEQVMRALDMILVTEEDLQVLFAPYQLQGDAL